VRSRAACLAIVAALAAGCGQVGDEVVATRPTEAGSQRRGRLVTAPAPSSLRPTTSTARRPDPTAASAATSAASASTAAGVGPASTLPTIPAVLAASTPDTLDDLADPAEADGWSEPVVRGPVVGRDISGDPAPTIGEAGAVAPAPPPGPLTDGSPKPGSALVVKIDNAWGAWPQAGINQADVVFELLVESISRFAAVFHSEEVAVVGPIRSARTSDFDLLAQLHRPLFAWSGGNPGVQAALATAPMVDVGAYVKGGAYYRSVHRDMPHNLMSSTAALREGSSGGAVAPIFTYVAPTTPLLGGRAVGGVEYALDGTRVQFVWSASERRWLRFQSGYAHLDADGVQVSPTNVVVLETEYLPSTVDARSPESQSIGGGRAWVLTEGAAVEGRWSRGGADQPYLLTDLRGLPLSLVPGRTWVALVPLGGSVRLLDTSFSR